MHERQLISFCCFLGMVFVVSFSSCLDVAAISMDMGEALDVNNELKTVGISNCEWFCSLTRIAVSRISLSS